MIIAILFNILFIAYFASILVFTQKFTETCKCNGIEKYLDDWRFKYISIVPATLFGKYAKYNKENSHVLTSLINKINPKNKKFFLWGTGLSRREFIFIKDFIDAIFFIHKKKLFKSVINVGTGKDYTIRDLAIKIKKIKNIDGKILWDKSKKDGTKKNYLTQSSYSEKVGNLKKV